MNLTTLVVGTSLLLATATGARPIDVASSSAQFSVKHIWVENVTGTVPILEGSVTLAPGSLIPVSAAAELDATRIHTDEPDRDRALQSPDFFDAAHFPRWSFSSTKIVPQDATRFEMDGDVTIHGVTQQEKFAVTASGTPEHPRYDATATIDRHSFGMAVTRLDPTIGGTAEIRLQIALK